MKSPKYKFEKYINKTKRINFSLLNIIRINEQIISNIIIKNKKLVTLNNLKINNKYANKIPINLLFLKKNNILLKKVKDNKNDKNIDFIISNFKKINAL